MEQHHIGNKFLMKYLKLIPISYVCLKIVHCYEMCLFGNDKAFGIFAIALIEEENKKAVFTTSLWTKPIE